MAALRIPFDPEAPFVASAAMTVAGKVYAERDPFPWQDLGLTLEVIACFWVAGKVDCLARELAEPVKAEPAPLPPPPQAASQPRPPKTRHAGR